MTINQGIYEYLYYLFCIFIVVLALYGWEKIWLSTGEIHIPANSLQNDKQILTQFKDAIQTIIQLLKTLDAEYFIKHIGFEGYSYLYFQRQMIFILIIYIIINWSVGFPFLMIFTDLEWWKTFKKINPSYHQQFQITFLFIYSSIFFYCLFQTRYFLKRQLQASLYLQCKNVSDLQFEMLKLRTVQLSIFPIKNQNYQQQIYQEIQNILIQKQIGSIVESVFIPNYTKLMHLENKKWKLQNDQNLISKCFCKCLYERLREKQIKSLDIEIQQCLNEQTEQSGKMFICFNNMKTVNQVLIEFSSQKSNLVDFIKKQFKINNEANAINDQNISNISQQDQDDFIDFEKERQGNIINSRYAQEPIDILWKNFNVAYQEQWGFIIKLFFYLASILLLLFVTTPASMLQTLQFQLLMNYIKQSGLGDLNLYFLSKVLPCLIISLANSLLFLLIDFFTYREKNNWISNMHISIFNKCLFYFSLNMLFIPLCSNATVSSIYEILSSHQQKLEEIIKNQYLHNYGQFFSLLIVQSGCFSFFFQILRIPELFSSYGSAKEAIRKSNLLQNEKYRRDETDMFEYGYYYGIQVTIIYIMLIFCTTVPIIHVSGLIFFCLKHFADAYNLLVAHKFECASVGRMIGRITLMCGFGCCIYLSLMFLSFMLNKEFLNGLLCLLLLFLSILLTCRLSNPLLDDIDLSQDKQDIKFTSKSIDLWKNNYQHPLEIIRNKEQNKDLKQ